MDITTRGPVSAASLVWRHGAGWVLTAVCKTVFDLAPGKARIRPEPAAPAEHDIPWDAPYGHTLHMASDLVPFKPRVDVTLSGHAYAPEGRALRSFTARLAVGALDKSIEIATDRYFDSSGALREGGPITHMPLVYERAAGGHGTWNLAGLPVGQCDSMGNMPLPNLLPAGTLITPPERLVLQPAGFSPLPADWPSRVEKLGRRSPRDLPKQWHGQTVPDDMAMEYFNVAPEDQQLAGFRGNETITLEHLHPSHPALAVQLPGACPAVLFEAGGEASAVPLSADTLHIDTDRTICIVIWRGHLAIPDRLTTGHLIVTLDAPGTGRRITSSFEAPQPTRSSERPFIAPPEEDRPSEVPGRPTMVLDDLSDDGSFAETPEPADPSFEPSWAGGDMGKAPGLPFKAPSGPDPLSQSSAWGSQSLPKVPPPLPSQSRAVPPPLPGQARAVPPPLPSQSRAVPPPPPARSGITLPMPPQPTQATPWSAPEAAPRDASTSGAWGIAPPAPEPGHATMTLSGGWGPVADAPPPQKTSSAWGAPAEAPEQTLAPPPDIESGAAPIHIPKMSPLPDFSPAPAAAVPAIAAAPVMVPPLAPSPPVVVPRVAPAPVPGNDSPWASGQSGPLKETIGMAAASGALALSEPSYERLKSAGPLAPLDDAERSPVQLLWHQPDCVARVRRVEPWSELLEDMERKPLERDLDHGDGAREPWEIEDRRELFEVVARGAAWSVKEVEGELESAKDRSGKFTPPLALLEGELEVQLDELEALKAAASAAASIMTPPDEAMRSAVEAADKFIGRPGLSVTPAVCEGLTLRVRDAFSRERKGLQADYLDRQVERALLSGRHYQKRLVLGGTYLRALLKPPGEKEAMVAYLPEDLQKKLPMHRRLTIRAIVDVHPQQDPYEARPYAVKVLALARVI